jgi:hypothetical protein
LLFIAMLGTCMLIGDGILTPAISGLWSFVVSFLCFFEIWFYFGLILWIHLILQSCLRWMELEHLFLLLPNVSFHTNFLYFADSFVFRVLFLLPRGNFHKMFQLRNRLSCWDCVQMLSRMSNVRAIWNVKRNFCLGDYNKGGKWPCIIHEQMPVNNKNGQ